jgi:hypothetical protein
LPPKWFRFSGDLTSPRGRSYHGVVEMLFWCTSTIHDRPERRSPTMSDPMNPTTLDDTQLMQGTVKSVAVECVGSPTVIFWITDDATSLEHQMNGPLDSGAVSRLGMLQLLQHAVVDKRDVIVRYTVDANGVMWFFLVRML